MPKQTQNFKDEEIKTIADKIEDIDIIEEDEKNNLKVLRTKSQTNSIIFASLFLVSYNYLKSVSYLLEDENIKKKLEILLSFNYSKKLRDLLEDYGDGKDIGSHYSGEKIKDIIKKKTQEMNHLIEFFFKMFILD